MIPFFAVHSVLGLISAVLMHLIPQTLKALVNIVVDRFKKKMRTVLADLYNQGGTCIRDGVPTSYNEFKQLSVFYGHTKEFYRCSGVFNARCSMPPTSWEEMKMDFNPILTGGGGGKIDPPPCTKSATASRPPQIATRLFMTFFFQVLRIF